MKNADLLKKASFGIGLARALNYTTQGALLPLLDKLTGGTRENPFQEFGQNIKLVLPKAQALLEKDSENIGNGLYPMSVLFNEAPFSHYARLPALIKDAFRANLQRKTRKAYEFENSDASFVEETPEYYRRNFHFQDGGYLSENSANLYDHQVEILFSGLAQVMRRQMIPSLKSHFQNSDGQGLKFLEIASGTGSLTKAIALAFPKAQIICIDPSPYYLQHAKKRLQDFRRISFVQGYGEDLDFKDHTFDAVFSCYLFHELPIDIRKKVIAEKLRVLKPAGYLGIADSIQTGDDPDLDWALKRFPADFHEPFYKNYVENSMEKLIQKISGKEVNKEIHFMTKVLSITK